MSAQYPVGTLAEMSLIPVEALPRFLAELPDMLGAWRELAAANQSLNNVLGGLGKIEAQRVIWVDDGERNRTVTVRAMDGGEVFSMSSKKVQS